MARWSEFPDAGALDAPAEVAILQQGVNRRAPYPGRTAGYLLVEDADDLPAPAGGEHLLPADTLVEFAGTIDLGGNAIRLQANTLPRGMGGDRIISSADGVVRASGLASAVVIRELSIVATGGRCLDLSGPIGQQLNVFFVGLIGAAPGTSAGTIDGFDVAAVKASLIDAPDGLTFGGASNKLFVHESPFYSIDGAAIRLAADLDVSVADIVTTFFKFDSPGIAVQAEAGYTVGRGVMRGSLFDGTVIPLDGLSETDRQWDLRSNPGIPDSSAVGAFVQNTGGQEVTPIATVNTPTKAVLTSDASSFNERFDHNGNGTLTYDALDPATFIVTATGNISSTGNNQAVRMWIAVNGTPLATARARAELSGGGDIDPVTAIGVVRLDPQDEVELYVENLTSAANITLVDASMSLSRTA